MGSFGEFRLPGGIAASSHVPSHSFLRAFPDKRREDTKAIVISVEKYRFADRLRSKLMKSARHSVLCYVLVSFHLHRVIYFFSSPGLDESDATEWLTSGGRYYFPNQVIPYSVLQYMIFHISNIHPILRFFTPQPSCFPSSFLIRSNRERSSMIRNSEKESSLSANWGSPLIRWNRGPSTTES